MKKLFIVGLAVLLLVAAAGCGKNKGEAGEVTVGYFPNVSHAPAMVGIENELFSKALKGIKVSTQHFPNGSLFMDALSTGQIDIGYVGPGPVINRYLQGGEVVVLAGASRGENVLVVRKDIPFTGLKDLEGRIVATPSTGCTHDLILRKMLQEAGLAVEENGGTVKRIAQKPATMIGLFQQKQIDAALVSEPWASIMEAQGVVDIVRDADEVPWGGNLPAAILVAGKDFAESNPDLVKNLIKVNSEAIEFIGSHPEDAVDIISGQIKQITNEEMDKAVIKKSMARIQFSADLDRQTLQEFSDLSKELGFVEGDSLLDGLYRQ